MVSKKYWTYIVIALIVGVCVAASMVIIGAYEFYNFDFLAKQVEMSGAYKSLGFESQSQWESERKLGIYLKLFVGIGMLVLISIIVARIRKVVSRGRST